MEKARVNRETPTGTARCFDASISARHCLEHGPNWRGMRRVRTTACNMVMAWRSIETMWHWNRHLLLCCNGAHLLNRHALRWSSSHTMHRLLCWEHWGWNTSHVKHRHRFATLKSCCFTFLRQSLERALPHSRPDLHINQAGLGDWFKLSVKI